MKNFVMTSLTLVLSLAGSAHAQDIIYWPQPIAAGQISSMAYFPMGTAVSLISRTDVSTKENKPGDRFYLEVAEAVMYRGQVVIPIGSMAVGEVSRSQRNGHFGKKGKLDIQLLYVQTPSGPIRLSGRANDEGTSGTVTSIATILIATPLGLLVHGTSARIPAGSAVRGFLAEDMRFAVQGPQTYVAMKVVTPDDARTIPHDGSGGALPARYEQLLAEPRFTTGAR